MKMLILATTIAAFTLTLSAGAMAKCNTYGNTTKCYDYKTGNRSTTTQGYNGTSKTRSSNDNTGTTWNSRTTKGYNGTSKTTGSSSTGSTWNSNTRSNGSTTYNGTTRNGSSYSKTCNRNGQCY